MTPLQPPLPLRLALVLVPLLAGPSAERAALGDPLLEPGPQAVGFRSHWTFDEGRSWRTAYDAGATYGAAKSPRPVLIHAWYPAERPSEERPRMQHGEYFAVESADERLVALSRALSAHARGVLVEALLEKAEPELDEGERAELERAHAAPTLCLRDAQPLAGSFPLILHHSGAGSSFEDDAAFCEWVGHSLGAQAFLKLAAEPGCAANALVLLDTTQDYYGLALPPTPRQFARLMIERGAEPACALLARFAQAQPRGPLYTSTMLAGSLLYELCERGRMEEARLYLASLREIPLPALGLFDFLARISTLQSKPEQARKLLRIACALAPEDAERAARLRELEDGGHR